MLTEDELSSLSDGIYCIDNPRDVPKESQDQTDPKLNLETPISHQILYCKHRNGTLFHNFL